MADALENPKRGKGAKKMIKRWFQVGPRAESLPPRYDFEVILLGLHQSREFVRILCLTRALDITLQIKESPFQTSSPTKTEIISEYGEPTSPFSELPAPVQLQKCDLYVELLSAEGVRAADSNGLSDPYCILRVGNHKASSCIKERTLSPVWHETFVFAPNDTSAAIDEGRPWILFQLYDKDLVSNDDFLGQAHLPFSTLHLQPEQRQAIWLPLTRVERNGRRVQEGQVHVVVWFECRSERLIHSASTIASLSYTPFKPKRVPTIVHLGESTLYEEPLMACLVLTLETLESALATTNVLSSGTPTSMKRRSRWFKSKSKTRKDFRTGEEDGGNEDGFLMPLGASPYGEDEDGDVDADEDATSPTHPFEHSEATADNLQISETSAATMLVDESNSLFYVKLVLGSQKHTSYLKEVKGGKIKWHQKFALAVAIPLRERTVRLELYKTPNTASRGRLVAVGSASVHDIVPTPDMLPPHAPPPSTRVTDARIPSRHVGIAGQSPKGIDLEVSFHVSGSLCDTDPRRELYGYSFHHAPPSVEKSESLHSTLERIQSQTKLLSDKRLEKMADMTIDQVEQYDATWRHTFVDTLSQGMSMAVTLPASYVSGWFVGSDAKGETVNDTVVDKVPPHLKQKQPLATLSAQFLNVRLNSPLTNCFLLWKCGPHWGRSAPLSVDADGSATALNWEVECPVHDPSTMLFLAVCTNAKRAHRKGLVAVGASSVMVGKLRVRLSTLSPNQTMTTDLPMLSDRKHGAQIIGSISMEFCLQYRGGAKSIVGAYLKPPLSNEMYIAGIEDDDCQHSWQLASRRMVLRWLQDARPEIASSLALALLDTEAETFVMSRAQVNILRIRLGLAKIGKFRKWLKRMQSWENPWESSVTMAGSFVLALAPRIFIPTWLAYVIYTAIKAKSIAAGLPLSMEQDPPGIESDNNELDVDSSVIALKAKLDRLTRVALKVQNMTDGVARGMERLHSMLSWEDPVATALFLGMLGVVALLIAVCGFGVTMAIVFFVLLRPPQLRTVTPPAPSALIGRLPTRSDRIM